MSTTINQLTIPHRRREAAFRLYEHVIAEAVNNFPQVVTIDPLQWGRSIETLSARCRDALASWEQYRWDTTLFTSTAFERARSSGLCVCQDPPFVRLGTRDTIAALSKSPIRPTGEVPVGVSAPELTFETPHVYQTAIMQLGEFHHLARLAADRVFTRPLQITVADPTWVETILSSYDVDIEPCDEPLTYILR